MNTSEPGGGGLPTQPGEGGAEGTVSVGGHNVSDRPPKGYTGAAGEEVTELLPTRLALSRCTLGLTPAFRPAQRMRVQNPSKLPSVLEVHA